MDLCTKNNLENAMIGFKGVKGLLLERKSLDNQDELKRQFMVESWLLVVTQGSL
jgi:hypothetical protein